MVQEDERPSTHHYNADSDFNNSDESEDNNENKFQKKIIDDSDSQEINEEDDYYYEQQGYMYDFPVRSNEESRSSNQDGEETIDLLAGSNELYKTLKSEDILDIISVPTDRSRGELIMIYLKFAIVNGLSHTAVTQLFKTINTMFAKSILPDTRYLVDKLFFSTDFLNYQAICSDCGSYVGTFCRSDQQKQCPICSKVILLRECFENFYVTFDVKFNIRELLERHSKYYDYVMRERVHENGIYKDIYDGKEYRKFVDSLEPEFRKQYASFVFNCDGAARFESSTISAYPIYIMINEIPIDARISELMICGLWFGKGKPDMNVFLHAFVENMNELSNIGIKCNIEGEKRIIKAYSICSCVNSVERCVMQGITQYNGHYGCSWCNHEGEYVRQPNGKGGSWKYPNLDQIPEDRTAENMLECMKLLVKPALHSTEPSNLAHSSAFETLQESAEPLIENLNTFGVQHVSPLTNLQKFYIVSGFVPDDLHFSRLGIAKKFLDYWINRKTSPLSKTLTARNIKEIDKILCNISVPHQAMRLTRSLSDRAYWKGKELENWILYYSLPILKLYLEKKYVDHWALFVEATYISIKKTITTQDLERLEDLIKRFVFYTEKLYTKSAMTYNVHQSLHWVTSLANWGPSYVHTTYPFESANGELLNTIKAAKGVVHQVCRNLSMKKCDTILRQAVLPQSSVRVKDLYINLSGKIAQKTFKLNSIRYFGAAKQVNRTLIDMFHLSQETVLYKRMIKEKCIYSSSKCEVERSDSTYAELENGSFIQIHNFLVNEKNKTEFTVYTALTTVNAFAGQCTFFKKINGRAKNLSIVDTNKIRMIFAFIQVNKVEYICPVPNMLYLG